LGKKRKGKKSHEKLQASSKVTTTIIQLLLFPYSTVQFFFHYFDGNIFQIRSNAPIQQADVNAIQFLPGDRPTSLPLDLTLCELRKIRADTSSGGSRVPLLKPRGRRSSYFLWC